MNRNSEAIVCLCSDMCISERIHPLTAVEWSRIARVLHGKNLTPASLFELTANDLSVLLGLDEAMGTRVRRLLDRSGSLNFELMDYLNIGIQVITRADPEYPKAIRQKLRDNCPPIFYAAGEPGLLALASVGFVGGRAVSEMDAAFIRQMTSRVSTVITGDDRGTGEAVAEEALSQEQPLIQVLSDSMCKRLRSSRLLRRLQSGQALLISVTHPNGLYRASGRSLQNACLFAQSRATVVIHAEKKDAIFTDAVSAMDQQLCPILCVDRMYEGNRSLIQMGAVPVDEQWDGDPEVAARRQTGGEQMSFF